MKRHPFPHPLAGTIQQHFDHLFTRVVLNRGDILEEFKEAHPVQYREMRRAFFAGAQFMMNVNIELGESHVGEEEGAAHLTARAKELQGFAAGIGEGGR